ncbi:tryptophan repressor-binding protein, partial [Burkholderia pseudomallei]
MVGSRLAGLSIPIPRIGANEAMELAPRACQPEFAARRCRRNGDRHPRRQSTGSQAGLHAGLTAFRTAAQRDSR